MKTFIPLFRRYDPRIALQLFLLLGMSVLVGCSTAYKPVSTVNQSINDAKLIALSNWEIRGRMAFKSAQESFSAYVHWQQWQDRFNFTLTNVVGVTLLTLTFDGSIATLTIDGETYQDSNPQQLLEAMSGWAIPLDSFPVWVKGLARSEDNTERDAQGLLLTIRPTGSASQWRVDYSGYSRETFVQQASAADINVVLPRQLSLSQQQSVDAQPVTIKLKINRWEVTNNEA